MPDDKRSVRIPDATWRALRMAALAHDLTIGEYIAYLHLRYSEGGLEVTDDIRAALDRSDETIRHAEETLAALRPTAKAPQPTCDLCMGNTDGETSQITTGVSGYIICRLCFVAYCKSKLSSLDFVRQYPNRR